MNKYVGAECSVCHEKLTKDDDVVVCPDCGAPYHRSCYQQKGRCVHYKEHKNGYVWSAPISDIPKQEQIICPHCQAVNRRGDQHCEQCNSLLAISQPHREMPKAPEQMEQNQQSQQKQGEWGIAGVSSQEFSAYMGSNAEYFLGRFRMLMVTPMQGSWNFSAFFFTYYYFFYRKLYKFGAILLILSLMLMVPNFLYAAENFKAIAPEMIGITIPYDQAFMDSMLVLSNRLSIFGFVIRFCCGMFANKLILKNAIYKINEARLEMGEKRDTRSYLSYLFYKGAPSRPAVIVVIGLLTVAYIGYSGYLVSLAMPYM